MSLKFSMVATHSKRENGEDKIFGINSKAKIACEKYGEKNVINSSIGVLLDDEGKMLILPTAIDILKSLEPEEIAAYAPIAGEPRFLEAVKKAAFGDYTPEGYIESVATPGGSGAIRHAIWNYSNMGDTILSADWFWGPYKTVTEEHGRKLDTFKLFDEDFKFNFKSFEDKVSQLLDIQRRLVILLNIPANNPTGLKLTDDEWEKLLNILKNYAKNKDNKIILFIDIAYIDFAGEESKSFMKKLGNLAENILPIVAFSMSKGYTLYGMRSGAMMCISSNKEIAREFKISCQFSNRGVWSNGTRSAMIVLAKIFEDKVLYEKVNNERQKLIDLVKERADIFLKEAKKYNLKLCPYTSGFFISIPCNNPEEVAEELAKRNVFLVPMGKGLRFAICSVPKDKCNIAPRIISEVIQKVDKK